MGAPLSTTSIARFSVFELNLSTGELRKHGVRIRLQQQPFAVLAALLERPGQLVTREELQQRLWPDGRFVDYEDGLATAVKKVRRALQDSSSTPRFVETLPKRGYRFIGQVEIHAVEPPTPAPVTEVAVPQDQPARTPWAIAGLALAALALVVALDSLGGEANLDEAGLETPPPIALTMDGGVTADPVVSADGKWVAYASDRDGGDDLDIWMQPLPPESGEPIQVTDRPGNEIRPDFSPSGEAIVWESYGTREASVYATSLVDHTERFIAHGSRPRYSPDGQWIAMRANGVAVVRRDGGSLRTLDVLTTIDGDIAWLPGSSRVVTVGKADEQGVAHLQITPIDGRDTRQLSLDALYEAYGESSKVELTNLRFAPGTHGVLVVISGTANLWHLKLSSDWASIEAVRQVLDLPVNGVQYPNLVEGRLVFGVRSSNVDLRALPIGPETAETSGGPVRLTDDPVWSGTASVSADGSVIAYAGETPDGAMRPWVKNLGTGESFLIDDRLTPAIKVQISPDGTKVSFAAFEGGPDERFEDGGSVRTISLFLHDRTSGTTREVCQGCGQASGWMSNGRKILTTTDPPNSGNTSIWLVDLETGQRTLLAEDLHFPTPVFATDDTRVVFSNRDRILSAPFRDDRMAPESEWIELVSGEDRYRFPVVSPGGEMLYFTSNRDSNWCIWARKLEPSSGRPDGEPFAVFHSHRFRSRMFPGFRTGLAVAPDKLIFNWVEDSGNVWMQEDVSVWK